MPITKTLTEFKAKVEDLASINGQIGAGNTFRHDTDSIEEKCNSAYGQYRELLVNRKFDYFMEETAAAALPSSRAATSENYSVIDWPAAALVLKRVDVLKSSDWDSLTEIDWSRIRDVAPRRASFTAERPLWYAVKTTGAPNAAALTVGKIALVPFATGGTFTLTYLPRHTPITDDSHLFVFHSEHGYMWAVWTVVAMITVRDRDKGKRHAPSLIERKMCEKEIGYFAAAATSTGGQNIRRKANYFR